MKKDTQRLLQKCGAGARMGVTGIAAVMRYVTDPQLLFLLSEYKEKHLRLAKRADGALLARGEKPKKPPCETCKWLNFKFCKGSRTYRYRCGVQGGFDKPPLYCKDYERRDEGGGAD